MSLENDKLEQYSAVLTEMAREPLRRPTDVLGELAPQISRDDLYEAFDELEEEGLIEKLEGPGRATIYGLTEEGEEAANLAEENSLDQEYLELVQEFSNPYQKMVSVHGLLEETAERDEAKNLVDEFYEENSMEEELFSAYIESEF